MTSLSMPHFIHSRPPRLNHPLISVTLAFGLAVAWLVASLAALGAFGSLSVVWAGANNCFATLDGVMIYSSGDAQAVREAVAVADPGDTVKVAGNCAGAVGGYVVNITQTLTLQGGYTTTNWNTSDPVANPTTLDALAVVGDRVVGVSASNVTLDGLAIINGRSTTGTSDHGGGVLVSAGSLFTLSRSLVYNNATVSTFGGGGGVAIVSGSGVVTGSVFISNSIGPSFGDGGGLFVVNGGTGWIYASSFYTNTGYQGGAISVQGSGDMHVADSYFQGNFSRGNGGALFPADLLFMTNTVAFNNVATHGGGAAYPLNGAYIENSQFISNSAGIQGGAIRVQNRFLVVRHSQFYSNSVSAIPSTGDGGAVQVSNNDASQPSILENNYFQGNWAAGQGGAASFEAGNTTATITLTANLLFDNYAVQGGGALDFGNGARAYLINNILARNRSTLTSTEAIEVGSGSAILAPDDRARVDGAPAQTPSGGSSLPAQLWGWHNTLASATTGSGLAIRAGTGVNGEAITLTNTIFDGFATGAALGQRNASIQLEGVLWHNVLTQTSGVTIAVTSVYTGDPLFVNRTAGDLHIQIGSAAFNNALTTTVTTDFDGEARPALGGPDLGADELQSLATYTLTVTPAGVGSGAITSDPAGIDCGITCAAAFNAGAVITLTAVPDVGSTFAGWSGDCSGLGACLVALTSDQSVVANFALVEYKLYLALIHQ